MGVKDKGRQQIAYIGHGMISRVRGIQNMTWQFDSSAKAYHTISELTLLIVTDFNQKSTSQNYIHSI